MYFIAATYASVSPRPRSSRTSVVGPVDRVAQVRDLRCLDDSQRRQLDALVVGEVQAGVEQALPVAEHDRRDVQLELVEQPDLHHVAQHRAATGHRHVLAARRLPGQLHRLLDAVGHERERRAARSLDDLVGPMGHDEHRRPERRLVAPRDLATLEHPAAHHVGTGRGERLLDDLGVDRPLARRRNPVAPATPWRRSPSG